MPIEKLGIRWGKNNSHLSKKEKSLIAVLVTELESLKDDVCNLQEECKSLRAALNEYSYTGDRTDLTVSKRWE